MLRQRSVHRVDKEQVRLAGVQPLFDAQLAVLNGNGRAPLGTESVGQFRIGSQIKASGLRFDTAAVFALTPNSPRTGIVFGVTYQTPAIFTPAK